MSDGSQKNKRQELLSEVMKNRLKCSLEKFETNDTLSCQRLFIKSIATSKDETTIKKNDAGRQIEFENGMSTKRYKC